MPICPRCEHQVKATDLNCTACGLQLKAHGHPSIELHQSINQDEVLCTTCAYHADDSCTFPQRPHAKACTLYQPLHQAVEQTTAELRSPARPLRSLWQRHRLWLILLALFGISLLIAMS